MKQKIRILFTDFWKGFEMENNFFSDLLKERYELEISDKPDLLIYSNYGREFLKYNCLKVVFISENIRPDYGLCDFSFSFDYGGYPNNYRLPLYALYDDVTKLTQSKNVDLMRAQKTKFCNFVYSNPRAKERIEFFKLLSGYKKVDAAGKVLNNVDYTIGEMPVDKMEFLKPYKFTIAFENASYPGYTTEKILQPMLAGSIPIYWGNPEVGKEFNEESFINVHRFANYKEVIDRVIEIDKNGALYSSYLSAPYFQNNQVPKELKRETILKHLDHIISSIGRQAPVSSTVAGILKRQSEATKPYLKKAGRLLRGGFLKKK